MTTESTQHHTGLFTRPAAIVEAAMETALNGAGLPEDLLEATKWGVLGGGKRLRPALVLLSCEAVGGTTDAAVQAAVSLELVHCFSLVHDDLPALDNDELRRGQPTLHVKSGEAMAILSGDLMLSMAFQQLTASPTDDAITRSLISELADGTTAMVVGQVYDTLGGLPLDLSPEEQLKLVHRNKTGALLRAACRMGALCGRADEEAMDCLTRYGESVGLMFQVVDDLLDVTQTTEHIGKATGKDEALGKLTFPGLLGTHADPLRDLGRYMAIRTK
jgi:geranylgeranyl pyrophosphate synthase